MKKRVFCTSDHTSENGDEMSEYIAIARRTEDRGNLVLGRAISEFMWGVFEMPHKFASMHEAQKVVKSTESPVHLNYVSIETNDAFMIVLEDWRKPNVAQENLN